MVSRVKTLRNIVEVNPAGGRPAPTWLWVLECPGGFEFITPWGKTSFIRELNFEKALQRSKLELGYIGEVACMF